MKLSDFFGLWTKNKWLLILLIVINLGGTAFGIYYYAQQFATASIYAWPVIADCPIAVALFAIALLLLLLGKKLPGVLATFAIFAVIKTGTWTIFTILLYNSFFLGPTNFWYYAMLLALHAGMVAEAGVLWQYASFDFRSLRYAAAWFLLNDFSDYYLGTVPWPVPMLDDALKLNLLGIESFAMTLLLTVGLWWFGDRKEAS
jgi:uncharacterized membrane protein YpjA